MCYSKEVSLIAGAGISIFSYWGWAKYVTAKAHQIVTKKLANTSRPLVDFAANMILGYMCIAGHQLFEFLAIWTGNEFIYKTGLLVSVSSTYFFLKAFEKLTKFNFYSWMIPVLISLLGIYQYFFTTFRFENYHFWVRGLDHWLWGFTWATFFVYINIVAGFLALKSKSLVNRRIFSWGTYGLLNVSYYLSVVFALAATLGRGMVSEWILPRAVTEGFDIIFDFASVWCTFAIAQGPFMIGLFAWMWKEYDLNAGFTIKKVSLKHIGILVGITVSIMLITRFSAPLMYGVFWKMVTK